MKSKVITGAFLLTLATIAMGQMKVYDKAGKALTSLSEKNTDIKVKVPVPEEAANHETIQYTISLQSKTDNRAEDINLGIISNGECYKDFKSSFLKDKKEVELWAVKSDNTSDFTKVFYDGDVFYFHLDDLKTNTKRNEQYYDLIVRVFGKDITSYEYKQDSWGNTIKEPIYSFTKLGTYKMSYDAGKPADAITSRHATFTLPKLDENTISLAISPPGEMPSFGTKKPFEINGWDQAFIKSSRYVGDHFYINVISMQATQDNIASLKNKIAENLVRDANAYYNHNSEFHPEDHIYVPEYCVTYVETTSNDEGSSKGIKGKLDKLKSDWNVAGGVTEEKLNAKIAYAQASLEWKPATLGGVSCEKIELQVYTKADLTANSSLKLYEVTPEKKGETRTFEVYLCQKGENVYVVILFKHGKDKNLSPDELKLRSSILEGLKFI